MALTNYQSNLIKMIAENDIRGAKKWALMCIDEDTTKKNEWFCKRYKQILESSASNMIELPMDLKNLLTVEDVTVSFKEGRYFLSERERNIYENIVRMKKANQRLMEMGIPYTNATLLYGESGTGKTTFGKYVAYKTGLPFCYLNFSHIVDSYLGSTSKNIGKAFTYAMSNPCVFMLDEIDCISIRRADSTSSGGAGGEMARITITLMQEFDKLPNDVVVIGATNRIDRIDEALLRRFSMKHEVEVLNDSEKKGMVHKYLDDVKMEFTEQEISEFIGRNGNQAMLLNDLVRGIAEKVLEEV